MSKHPQQPAQQPAQQPQQPAAVAFVSDHAGIVYPTAPGGAVQFVAGRYVTSDPAVIAFLDERDSCRREA